jgi:UPF0755 protein
LKLMAKIFLVLLLLAAGAAAYIWYAIEKPYQRFASDGVFVTIPKGASRRAAARILEREGVVRSSIALEFYARRHPRRTLQAGEYFFSAPATGKDIFWALANGNVYAQPFTVLEGQTIFDIAQDLQTAKFMLADDFLKAASDPAAVQDIAPQAKTLEGFLFPATYHLPRHPAAAELTAEMVKKFKEEWAHIAPASYESSQSVTSVVTLASLVERETPRPEERPLVASVFENRVRKGMLMQCDPTVVYALQQAGGYTGTLSTKDLHFDSPYNTYVHAGLPPGPIGNPGEASLRAALKPAQSDYLYFVANTQGGHFFSATLAEHNKNVLKYHRLLAGLPADPPPTPAVTKKPHAKKHRRGAA